MKQPIQGGPGGPERSRGPIKLGERTLAGFENPGPNRWPEAGQRDRGGTSDVKKAIDVAAVVTKRIAVGANNEPSPDVAWNPKRIGNRDYGFSA